MEHPPCIHFDDVEPQHIDRGELRATRWRLGAAAGTARAGLSRYVMEPGQRAMPVHVHADEEEIFYVLSGSGVSWQDGRTYRVSAGDCIVHLAGTQAHTIVAGDEGLDVLAFGGGSDTHITYLPRAQAWWLGPHWLPQDGPNPFRAEAAAGPLEVPEPEAQRPATIVATADARAERDERGATRITELDLGRTAGSRQTGIRLQQIDPRARGWPHHCHGAEEEILVVLEGDGTLRLGDERHPVRAGHVIARPPGTRIAHSFHAGDDGLQLLAWGTRVPNDIAYYPDSGKVYWRGVGVMARVEKAAYWDGEA